MPQPQITVAASEKTIDGIFLSPRVVDREAYHEYAAALRALIEHATERAAELRRAVAEADAALRGAADLAPKHQSRVELGARLLATLDQRMKDAEASFARVREAGEMVARFETRSESLLASRLAEVESRLAASADRAAHEASERLTAAGAAIVDDARSAAGAGASELLVQAARHRECLDARATELERDLMEMGGQLEAVARTLAARMADAATGHLTQLSDGAAALAERAGQRSEALLAEIESRRADAAATLDRLARDAASLRATLGGEFGPRIDALGGLCARAERLIGDASRPGESPLGELVFRAESALERAQGTLSMLESARERAAGVRQEIAAEFTRALDLADRLSARQAELDGSVRATLDLCRDADAVLRARAGDLDERARVTTAGAAAALDRLGALRDETGRLLEEHERLGERMTSLAAQLAPWRAVLSGRAGPDDLPAPLGEIVVTVRKELREDLSRIAGALRDVADRTDGLLGPGAGS
ncbi:MAG: hypothetical protein JNM07_07525 [Phycisphaerae bacterium]|nr:hypothetical protein [Phycisphaerae bacterium]